MWSKSFNVRTAWSKSQYPHTLNLYFLHNKTQTKTYSPLCDPSVYKFIRFSFHNLHTYSTNTNILILTAVPRFLPGSYSFTPTLLVSTHSDAQTISKLHNVLWPDNQRSAGGDDTSPSRGHCTAAKSAWCSLMPLVPYSEHAEDHLLCSLARSRSQSEWIPHPPTHPPTCESRLTLSLHQPLVWIIWRGRLSWEVPWARSWYTSV